MKLTPRYICDGFLNWLFVGGASVYEYMLTTIAIRISPVERNVDVVANSESFVGAQQLQLDTNQWANIMLSPR